MSSRYDLDIPAVGAAGPGYATKINDAIATLNGDHIVDTIDDRDAIPSPAPMAFCLVKSIDRIYWWDDDTTTWKSVADIDYINVLDFGAHWSLTDNAPAFQAASDSSVAGGEGGTDPRRTILIPSPPEGGNQEYAFAAPWNLRKSGGLRILALAGNKSGFGAGSGSVMLMNTTNGQPIIDADKEADSLSTFTPNIFENVSFYQPSATPFYASGIHQWQFRSCTFSTFADEHVFRVQNSFGCAFSGCAFVNNNGSLVGLVGASGEGGTSSDAGTSYLFEFNNCFFSGGPWMEYIGKPGHNDTYMNHYWEGCSGENPGAQNGMFFRVTTMPGAATTQCQGLAFSNCWLADPVSGLGEPYALISLPTDSLLANVLFDNANPLFAGLPRIQVRTTGLTGPYVIGIHSRGGSFVTVDNEDHEPWPFASIHTQSPYGSTTFGPPTDGVTGGQDMSMYDTPQNGGDRRGVWGNEFASIMTSPDGRILWGSGEDAAADLWADRVAEKTLGLGDFQAFQAGGCFTFNRPDASDYPEGACIFEKTLNQPIYSDGTVWRDAMGATI